MNPSIAMRRGLLALAIAAAVSFTALAHESNYEETRIDVRTQSGTVETVLVGALAAGESRQTTTISGQPALVSAVEAGLKLGIAGETFDIPLPDGDAAEAMGGKVMRIEKHIEHADHADGAKHKKIVMRHHGADAKAGADIDLDDPGPLADGQRIRVIRQVRHEIADTKTVE